MWSQFVQAFLQILVELLEKLSVPLLAYFAGRNEILNDIRDQELQNANKINTIRKDNLAKSDADILNELLRDDSRKES